LTGLDKLQRDVLAAFFAREQDFGAAIAIFEDLGSQIELGRTLVLRGGDDDLARARELFQGCGAAGDLVNLN